MRNSLYLTLILLLSSITILHAQDNFRPGYIITNENDTVFGKIDFRTAERNAQVCNFRVDTSDAIQRYEPGDIYAYRFTDDGKFYVTRTVVLGEAPRKIFLEYLVKGVISLYFYRASASLHYFFEDENGQLIEVQDKETAVKINRVPGIKKDSRYIGIMTLLFGQSEKIKKQLPKIRLDKETLSRITKEFHNETCRTGEECVEFEFKPDTHFFRLGFALSAGVRVHSFSSKAVANYWSTLNISSENVENVFPAIMAQADVFIPRLTDYVSFRLDAELSKVGGSNELTTEHTYNRFNLSAFLTDIRAGLCFKLCHTRIYPTIGGGFCDTFLWNMDADNFRRVTVGDKEQVDNIDFSDKISKNYIGFYVNAGVVFPLKTGSLFVQGLMEQRKKSGNKLLSWGGSIGYRF